MKKIVIQPNSKIITAITKPKPKPASTHQSRPQTKPSQSSSSQSSQTQPNKASGSQQSRSRTADQKEKNGKEKHKDKEKGPNPYSKGASADPIKLVNRFDSLENMEVLLHALAVSEKTKGLSSLFYIISPFIMDKKSIIQWNCRGLEANYNEILILTTLLSPTVFCLQ